MRVLVLVSCSCLITVRMKDSCPSGLQEIMKVAHMLHVVGGYIVQLFQLHGVLSTALNFYAAAHLCLETYARFQKTVPETVPFWFHVRVASPKWF